jgi:hypothetical protein
MTKMILLQSIKTKTKIKLTIQKTRMFIKNKFKFKRKEIKHSIIVKIKED